MMLDWNSLFNSMFTGLFVGAGSTIGTWLITRHFLRNLEKLEEKVRKQDFLNYGDKND